MDSNQKPVGNVCQSQSSSSRRVMWKVRDQKEEEVYDSVVNYRRMSPPRQIGSSSSVSEPEQSTTSETKSLMPDEKWMALLKPMSQGGQKNLQETVTKSATSLALRYKPSHESLQELASTKRARAIGYWHHLFERIRNKKLSIELSPSLALRYRPSHESLQNRRSKDVLAPRTTSSSNPRLVTADMKLETCFFPPYQTAVVREAAPKFANRLCPPDDTDSCCSAPLELCIPLLKSSKSRKIPSISADLAPDSTSFVSETPTKNGNSRPKRRINKTAASSSVSGGGGASKGNSSKPTSSGGTSNAAPTLRQRQLELHRIRVLIEKRRLELLDLKIVRERADALRHEILFHKDLQLKHNQIKSYEDNNSSQA